MKIPNLTTLSYPSLSSFLSYFASKLATYQLVVLRTAHNYQQDRAQVWKLPLDYVYLLYADILSTLFYMKSNNYRICFVF